MPDGFYGVTTVIFQSTVRITKSRKDAAWHTVPSTVEVAGALRRGGYYDALAGDARAYLDHTNQFLAGVGYDIAGYYLESTKYGITRLYRIVNAAIGERHATDGTLTHIEVDLEEVK